MLSHHSVVGRRLLDSIFTRPAVGDNPLLRRVWLWGLYLLGVFLWGRFFGWAQSPLDYHDWVDITLPRLYVVQDALRAGVFPFHVADTAALHDVSDRFLVIPDVITSPQILLLRFIEVKTFVLVDVLINYSIGMAGLLWVRRVFGLSLVSFTALFLLFNFNGYILAHFSVGHFTWGGYFLFPIVLVLVWSLVQGPVGWRWTAAFATTLFYMVLSGGQHHFAWILVFMVPLALRTRQQAQTVLLSCACAGLLSAVRLLPPVLALSVYAERPEFNGALGYPSLWHVLQAMFLIAVPTESASRVSDLKFYTLNLWEFYYYVGLVGTAFVLYFGVWGWKTANSTWKTLAIPVVAVLFLCLGSNFRFVTSLHIPLFGSERTTARMVSVPMTFVIVLAVTRFQDWLDRHLVADRMKAIAASLAGLAFLYSDLWENFKNWRIVNRASVFDSTPLVLIRPAVSNHADPAYFTVVSIGFGVTILTALFLGVMVWRESKREASHGLVDG